MNQTDQKRGERRALAIGGSPAKWLSAAASAFGRIIA